MRVYRVSKLDGSPSLDVPFKEHRDALQVLAGPISRRSGWNEMPVVRMKSRGVPKSAPIADFTYLISSHFPAFSQRAKLLLEPLLDDSAEWLPLRFEEDPSPRWLLNLLPRPGIIDRKRSVIRRQPEWVTSYVFDPGALDGLYLFVAQARPWPVLATDAMVSLAKQHDLTGMYLRPVWDRDVPPFTLDVTSDDVLARPDVFGPEGFVKGFEDCWPPEWHAQAAARRMKTE